MNFYPFHIGDYASVTAHLSMIEDACYRRLLDAYYAREAPIPLDLRQACRLVRAQSKDERRAVEEVLREFFHEAPDGWRHKRCDAEIAAAVEKSAESDARKANERERQKRHRERRQDLFTKLRERGEVPAFDTPTDVLQRMADAPLRHAPVTVTARDGNGNGNGDVTRTDTQTQRLTNPNPNPNPKIKDKNQGAVAPRFEPPDWVPTADWLAFDEHRRKAKKPMTDRAKQLVVLELDKLRKAGHPPGPVLQQSVRRGWLDVFPLKADAIPASPSHAMTRQTASSV